MKKVLPVLFAAVLLSGCMTEYAKFPSSTLLSSAAVPVDAPIVGVSQVVDMRPDDKAGKISALRIAAGEDMLVYINGSIRSKLASAGYRSVDAPNPESLAPEQAKSLFGGKVIVPILQEASISSADALLDTTDAGISLILKVYDPASAKSLYARQQMGQAKERLGIVSSGKKPGELMARAADAAVDAFWSDSEFIQSLKPVA